MCCVTLSGIPTCVQALCDFDSNNTKRESFPLKVETYRCIVVLNRVRPEVAPAE